MNLKGYSRLLLLILDLVNSGYSDEANNDKCKPSDSNSDFEAFTSGANDVVVVKQEDGSLASTPFQIQVGKFHNFKTLFKSREGRQVNIEINGIKSNVKMTIQDSGMACFSRPTFRYNFSRPELERFNLRSGINRGQYSVSELGVEIPFLVYLLDYDNKLVITDVDGTITEQDVKGRVFPTFGFKANHDGIVRLLDKVVQNGYVVVYLTGRSMGEDHDTRTYLFETLDNTDGGHSLPFGPLFMSPVSMAEAIFDHVAGNSHIQKIKTLESLFGLFELGTESVELALGNMQSDQRAYENVGISPFRVYIVDSDGKVKNMADQSFTTYKDMADKVDELFPPVFSTQY